MLYIPRSVDDWHEAVLAADYSTLSDAALSFRFNEDLRAAEMRCWQRRAIS